ncbi:MAG: ABC transporter permease [Flammeovirgaceae bacterium]|nr:ABC transporter permease [Flammeovirgaceae bacterium]
MQSLSDNPEYTIDSGSRQLMNMGELWKYRELFYFFTWRDIKIKYKQTVLGFLWAIIQPVLMMAIFTLFFGHALNVPSQNIPYPVFVFSGLLLWNLYSTGLSSSANSMVSNSHIIKKIYFPRLIVPVSSVLVALFDFVMALCLFIVLLIYYQQAVDLSALWLWPTGILITLIATLGPGTWIAALNVKYRDFRYVIPFLIQVLFFLTPVIYPIGMLEHEILQYIVAISPMYAAIELFRIPIVNESPDLLLIGISAISSILFLIGGLFYFKKN